MSNKYTLKPDIRNGKNVFRVVALRDIKAYNVKAGDVGGFVDSEANLTHFGNCWIKDNAYASESSRVMGDSLICDNVLLYENTQIRGNAICMENATICGNVVVDKCSMVKGHCNISGDCVITDYSTVEGWANLSEKTIVYGTSIIGGTAVFSGTSFVDSETPIVSGNFVRNDESINLFHDSAGNEYERTFEEDGTETITLVSRTDTKKDNNFDTDFTDGFDMWFKG